MNLDEVKYENEIQTRVKEFEEAQAKAVAGIVPMDAFRFLSREERIEIETMASRIRRKYLTGSTDTTDLMHVPGVLTQEQAFLLAGRELESENASRVETINARADRRIERKNAELQRADETRHRRLSQINNEASRRGMLNSTIVLDQIRRIEDAHMTFVRAVSSEVSFIDNQRDIDLDNLSRTTAQRINAAAKRLHSESLRQNLAAVREKSLQQSRSYRQWVDLERNVMNVVTESRRNTAMLEEIYEAFFKFLAEQDPVRAYVLVDSDPTFALNLRDTTTNNATERSRFWVRLRTAMSDRAIRITPS